MQPHWPCIKGLSWLAVEHTHNFPSHTPSQAHPDPNLVAAAFENSSLKFSKEPNLAFIASAIAPVGIPPPL